MSDVEKVPRDELNLSRREVMGASAIASSAVLSGTMPTGAMAQSDPPNEISGTVQDVDGNAVDGSTVIAVPHDSSLDVLVTTSDANGAYSFQEDDLYTGDNLYHVVARNGTQSSPQRSQENYPFLLANGGAAIPDSGVLRATFNDADTSGSTAEDVWNGYDGAISGATTGVTGQFGEAYSHDGVDDQVNFGPVSEATGVAEASLSVWVNLDQTYSNTHTVFASYEDATRQLSINLGNGNWFFRVSDGTDTVTVEPSAQTTGSYVHLVLTYNSGTLTAYVNADSGTSGTGGPSTTPGDLGAFRTGYAANVDRYTAADIDDPQIYSKELTASEVSTINSEGSL